MKQDYFEFVEKFKPKKTTDDCYTPENVYNVVAEYCRKRYGDRPVVRPFWPGGNYEEFEYPDNCMVVDNPPFSIVTKICRHYNREGIKFFLFAPGLVMSGCRSGGVTLVAADSAITYANGANVRTNFYTNMEPGILARSDPGLHDALEAAEKENLRKQKRHLPKLQFPDAVLTAARMNYFAGHHVEFTVRAEDAVIVHNLDNYGSVFGYGMFLSERAAAERAAAERAAAERAAALRVELSPREMEMQRILSKKKTDG